MRNDNICLIMPSLNEAPNLRWVLPQIENKYRVIVVDNRSTDDTKIVAAKHNVEYVYCREAGYGNAVLAGIGHLQRSKKTEPDVIVIFDADGTSPASAIPAVVSPIVDGEKDFVIGQRTFKQKGAMPFHADFGNRLTVFLMHLLTGYKYQEMGPLRALRYQSLLKLDMIDRTWGWNVEMQMKAVWQKLRITEVRIEYLRRRHGRSKISGSLIGSVRAGSKILSRIAYFYIQYKWSRALSSSRITSESKVHPL